MRSTTRLAVAFIATATVVCALLLFNSEEGAAVEQSSPSSAERAALPSSAPEPLSPAASLDRQEFATPGNLAIMVRGGPELGIHELEILVFEPDTIENADSNAAVPAGARLGKVVARRLVKLVHSEETVSLTVATGTDILCAIRTPSRAIGSAEAILLPVVSPRLHLLPGVPGTWDCDLPTCGRLTLAPGDRVTCERIAINAWDDASQELLTEIVIVPPRPLSVLGPAGKTIEVWGNGGGFAFPIRLVSDTQKPLSIPAEPASDVLTPQWPSGRLIVYQDGVAQSVEYRLGLEVGQIEREEYGLDHRMVCLQGLRDTGWDSFYIQIRGCPMTTVLIDSLEHTSTGDVHVDLASSQPSTVHIVASGPIEHGIWDVYARPTSGWHNGIKFAADDETWTAAPLNDGSWDFYWKHKKKSVFVEAALRHMVEPGTERTLVCEFREPTSARVRFINWRDIPQGMVPRGVYIDHVPAKRTDEAGVYTADYARSVERPPTIMLFAPSVGGKMIAENVEWTGSEIQAVVPLAGLTTVSVTPLFGGDLSVRVYGVGTYPMPDLPRIPIGREIAPVENSSFRFAGMDRIACAATEVDQASNHPILRGFFVVDPAQPAPIEYNLRGRWVEVIAENSGTLTAKATLIGQDVQAMVKQIKPGSNRVWIPDSARLIEWMSINGRREFDAADISNGSRLE